VGNKSDFASKRMVEYKEAAKFAQDNGLEYIETSAKTNSNVEEAFMTLEIFQFQEIIFFFSVEASASGLNINNNANSQSNWCPC
jgi:hypothetical protein